MRTKDTSSAQRTSSRSALGKALRAGTALKRASSLLMKATARATQGENDLKRVAALALRDTSLTPGKTKKDRELASDLKRIRAELEDLAKLAEASCQLLGTIREQPGQEAGQEAGVGGEGGREGHPGEPGQQGKQGGQTRSGVAEGGAGGKAGEKTGEQKSGMEVGAGGRGGHGGQPGEPGQRGEKGGRGKSDEAGHLGGAGGEGGRAGEETGQAGQKGQKGQRGESPEAGQGGQGGQGGRGTEEINSLKKKNVELEQFNSIASHDLQEPLRKIATYGDLLLKSPNLDTRDKEMCDKMQRASLRMSRVIEDLLQYSRLETRKVEFEKVVLDQVLTEIRSDLELKIQESKATIVAGPLPEVTGNKVQLQHLLQNLILNSIKYAKPGRPPVIRIFGEETEGKVVLIVQDNGIGFEQKYAEKIFQPFQRLHNKEEFEGSGIGLAICQRIVESHHGTITAEGRPGEGATFRIILPA